MSTFDDLARELSQLPAEERDARLDALRKTAVLQAPTDKVAKPPPVSTLREYLEHKIEAPPAVVGPKQVLRGGLTVLGSHTGTGKTTVTLNRIVRWSAGRPMFDELPETMVPERPVRSLVVENEGVPAEFQDALSKIVARVPDDLREAALENVLVWGEGGWPRVKMDNTEHVDMVRRAIEQFEPDLVLLEPLRTLWSGEENSPTEAANVMDALADLAVQYNIGIYIIHHFRKTGVGEGGSYNEALRGGGPIGDYASVIEYWKRVNEDTSELGWSKSRYHKQGEPVRMQFDGTIWGYTPVLLGEEESRVRAVLRSAGGAWLTVHDVAEELEDEVTRVRRVLNRIADDEDSNVQTMAGTSAPGGGSTGKRYRYADEDDGSLPV